MMMTTFPKNPLILKLNKKNITILGILMGTASLLMVPPLNLYIFEFLFLVPFCYLYHPENQNLSKKSVFLFGFLLGLFIMVSNFYWITHTMMKFGNLSLFVAALIFLVYSSYIALKMAFIFFFPYLFKRVWNIPPLLSLLFFCFFVELFFPEIFPFYLGNAQLYHSYFVQIADIVGVGGISLLVILVNYLIYRYLSSLEKRYLLMIAIVFFSTYSYSFLRKIQIESYILKHKDITQFRVGVVQPNIPFSSPSDSFFSSVVEKLRNQTDKLLLANENLDLIVWPESAIPFSLTQEPYGRMLKDYIDSLSVPIIYNAIWRENNGDSFSAAVLYKKSLPLIQHYNKNVLLPFGEYLPTDTLFPSWHNSFPEIGDFSRGNTQNILVLNDRVKIAPQICYEITLPYFTRKFIKLGGNVIVNLTNDSWFGNTRASLLHLWVASFRAIENRVPIIRATNTGISSVIGIYGWALRKKTPLFQETQFTQTIPLYQKVHALYSYLGDFPLGIFLIIIFGRTFIRSRRTSLK